MNSFIPPGEGIDMENLSLTDTVQVSNQVPLAILSKDRDQIEGFEKPGKVEIKGSSPNKKGGHAFLINGKNLFGIESVLDEFQDSRVTHENGPGLRKRLSKDFEGRQSKNEIAESPLMNNQHRSDWNRLVVHGRRHPILLNGLGPIAFWGFGGWGRLLQGPF